VALNPCVYKSPQISSKKVEGKLIHLTKKINKKSDAFQLSFFFSIVRVKKEKKKRNSSK